MKSEKKAVVVIGNGPSSITLSYILSGHWPYYDTGNPHPNPELHQRLISQTKGGRKSLLECDLQVLSTGLQGRSINPVSVLFDSLQNPDADFGIENSSCLKWVLHPERRVDHVVLGQGAVGGSWNQMRDLTDTFTVSFAQWMQLPNCRIEDPKSGRRISLGRVAKYYEQYVRDQGLSSFFQNHSLVTALTFNEIKKSWKVSGWQKGQGSFEYQSDRVVLATGNSDAPNRLNVPGEDLAEVFHSLTDLDRILADARNSNSRDAVVVVGSGLTAADAIIACSMHQVPVRHVFRRHPEDPALVFNQLPDNLYPEYHAVHAGMKGNSTDLDYKSFPMHSVLEIRKNREVVLSNLLSDDEIIAPTTTIRYSYILVLIGRRPDLSFVRSDKLKEELPHFSGEPLNPRSNPVRIDPFSHLCTCHPRLYAMGPLVGDNFVRFVQGAALAIASHISTVRKKKSLLERKVKSK